MHCKLIHIVLFCPVRQWSNWIRQLPLSPCARKHPWGGIQVPQPVTKISRDSPPCVMSDLTVYNPLCAPPGQWGDTPWDSAGQAEGDATKILSEITPHFPGCEHDTLVTRFYLILYSDPMVVTVAPTPYYYTLSLSPLLYPGETGDPLLLRHPPLYQVVLHKVHVPPPPPP